MEEGDVRNEPLQEDRSQVIREYDIGKTRYIVTSTQRTGVTEDAVTKVRRLIKKEVLERFRT